MNQAGQLSQKIKGDTKPKHKFKIVIQLEKPNGNKILLDRFVDVPVTPKNTIHNSPNKNGEASKQENVYSNSWELEQTMETIVELADLILEKATKDNIAYRWDMYSYNVEQLELHKSEKERYSISLYDMQFPIYDTNHNKNGSKEKLVAKKYLKTLAFESNDNFKIEFWKCFKAMLLDETAVPNIIASIFHKNTDKRMRSILITSLKNFIYSNKEYYDLINGISEMEEYNVDSFHLLRASVGKTKSMKNILLLAEQKVYDKNPPLNDVVYMPYSDYKWMPIENDKLTLVDGIRGTIFNLMIKNHYTNIHYNKNGYNN